VVYKISVDQLAEQLNRENKYLNATAEALAIYRDIFRQSMPDVNPNHNDPDLLPIESSMISWSYLTGDDGSMEEGSLPAIDQTKAEKLISLNDDGTLQTQFFGIDWVIVGVVVFISAALVCGYQNLIAVTEYIDPWTGNKIEDDEQWYMCWIEKRGRSSVKHTETTYLSKKYYTLENLSDAATLASEYLEVNYDPTGYGLALLDSANNNQIGIANNSSFHSQSTDGRIIKFPEDEWLPYLQKGDLIFKKSTRDDIVTKMSFISHVAIFYSKKKEGKPSQVFESMITGVNLYDLGSNWKDDYFYSVRRIANTSASTIAQAVETSVNTWEGSLFRPDIRTPNDGESDPETLKLLTKIDYFREWSDKYNTSGIYCSKLIWLTFKDMKNNFGEYVDLDSNATRAKSNVPRSYLISGNDTGNYGESIWNAYIGVSPDDIFEQKAGAISFALARSKVG